MRSGNSLFPRALHLVSHPLSILAILLVLVNDLLLRWIRPSLLTGKLSDLGWLFFTPLFLAVLLAWFVPQGSDPDRREKVLFSLSFGTCGLAFILLKTLPGLNLALNNLILDLTGHPLSLRLDPSDLLALPGLAGSAALWWFTRSQSARQFPQVQSNPGWGRLLLLPLAALVLLGDAAAPDPGIMCFARSGNAIVADSGYSSYNSTDGGLTWSAGKQPDPATRCTRKSPQPGQWQAVPGPKVGVVYRYQPNQEIQFSTDGGKTWQIGMRLSPVSEAERMYMAKSRPGNVLFEPGPLDAIADPATGNMLFAMGHEGVLVHTAGGDWQWSAGTPYQRLTGFPTADAFAVLLGGQLILAFGLALVVFSLLALRWTRNIWRVIVVALAGLVWLGLDILFPPATSYGYAETITVFALLAFGLLELPLVIEQAIRLNRRARGSLPKIAGIALLAGLLYFIPYVLWLYHLLPAFEWATTAGLVIAGGVLVAGIFLIGKGTISAHA